MKRNLYCVLYRRLAASGKFDTLNQMLHDLYRDHHQAVQLTSIAGNTMKQNSVTIDKNANDIRNSSTIGTIQTYVNIP